MILLLFFFSHPVMANCNPTDGSIPGLPVPHHLPEFAQVPCIGDDIQLSHPLVPSSPALNLSQHQRL